MVKFYFPRDLSLLQGIVPPERLKRDLIMVAEVSGKIQALCCFYYKGNTVTINTIMECEENVELKILDGLLRSALFHTAELEYNDVVILESPSIMKGGYFQALDFAEKDNIWSCKDYPAKLFSGCSACQAHAKDNEEK